MIESGKKFFNPWILYKQPLNLEIEKSGARFNLKGRGANHTSGIINRANWKVKEL
jgi:hypothetical protein